MTDTPTPAELHAVLLSREEVLVILTLTGRSFPELSGEPIADLTDAQRAYGLIVAERALRARQLSILDAEGNTRIDQNVLRLVLGCTTNGDKVIVTRIDPATARASQASAHYFDGQWIIHSQPFAGIHAFQKGGAWEATWATLSAFVGYPDAQSGPGASLTIAQERFTEVRSAALEGGQEAARTLLAEVSESEGEGFVSELAALLASPHLMTVIQVARPKGDDLTLQSLTTFHNETQMVVAVHPEGSAGRVAIQPVTRQPLFAAVTTMLTKPLPG